MRVGSVAEAAIKEALSDLGFKIEKEQVSAEDLRIDLLARKGSDRYAVELKAQAPFRREQFRGAVADSILGLNFVRKIRPWKPLLCVWLDKASPKALSELQEYVRKYASHLNWLVVDGRGWRMWQIGRQKGEQLKPLHAYLDSWNAPGRALNPFSPGYQWMLKILLLAGLDEQYWGGPQQRPLNISELAQVAQVSQSHASNFVAALENQDYLRRGNKKFHFPDIRRLLDDWASAQRFRLGRIFHVKPLHPQASPDESLKDLLGSLAEVEKIRDTRRYPAGAVLSSHYACHLLGLGYSNVKSLRLYVNGSVPTVMHELNLVRAEPDQALWELIDPRAKDSIFGGRVYAGDLMVCDVLQCYLDVRSSFARGSEQAEFIFRKVLEPHFRKSGWF